MPRARRAEWEEDLARHLVVADGESAQRGAGLNGRQLQAALIERAEDAFAQRGVVAEEQEVALALRQVD